MSKVIVHSIPDYTHAMLATTENQGFVIDEPVDFEGNDFGPTPYQLLTAALAGCTAMTIQMYARRKKYPLEEVAIEVEHDRTHAKDCEKCEEPKAGRIEVFHRHIVLRGPLTDEQRDDLLRIASRCPVHKTLEAAPEVIDSVEVVE